MAKARQSARIYVIAERPQLEGRKPRDRSHAVFVVEGACAVFQGWFIYANAGPGHRVIHRLRD